MSSLNNENIKFGHGDSLRHASHQMKCGLEQDSIRIPKRVLDIPAGKTGKFRSINVLKL